MDRAEVQERTEALVGFALHLAEVLGSHECAVETGVTMGFALGARTAFLYPEVAHELTKLIESGLPGGKLETGVAEGVEEYLRSVADVIGGE